MDLTTLLLLGGAALLLFGGNFGIDDKISSVYKDLQAALDEVNAANQEAEQPNTTDAATTTSHNTTTDVAVNAPAQEEAKVSIYEANYMKNSIAKTLSNNSFQVRMGFYNYYVQNGYMYQNGLIAIKNKSKYLQIISDITPSISKNQKTQTGGQIIYGSEVPWSMAIAVNDKVYPDVDKKKPVYDHFTITVGADKIYYIPFTVEIKIYDNIVSFPYIASDNIASAPVSLNVELSFTADNGSKQYNYSGSLPLSDWNSGSPNYYQF